MAKKQDLKNSPKVLGLDISTKTIGWALFDIQSEKLLELTHFSPVIKPQPEEKIEELILKVNSFIKKIEDYKNLGITKVVIEEPLLGSNNIHTVGTLMKSHTNQLNINNARRNTLHLNIIENLDDFDNYFTITV